MENYPLLAPLVILVPSVGAFINFFWGKKMGEKLSGITAITAALIAFAVSIALFAFSNGTHGGAMVVDPPFFDGWLRIDSVGFDIPWQLRVDPISITMMLVVTGVGSLIHIYAVGYMHGDPKFPRFFAFLNMFLAFMLVLVTGNNFLMMFVGWEGVGLCSYLLIGFWWDKAMPEGWKNSNAARKAFIVNRVGDFGLLMAMFLIFWTFGTLNYFSPGETANVPYALEVNGFVESAYGEEADGYGEAAADDGYGEAAADDGHGEAAADDGHGEAAADGYGGHGEAIAMEDIDNSRIAPDQLGVFGQAAYLNSLPEGDPGRMIDFGSFQLDIHDVLILVTAFMLIGVTGKSAQIPLFVWLPDAMAGPTPVSALIHAATMVTAGVYLMVRSSVFFDIAVEVRFVVAVVGAVTALMAGFIALGQWDIKRVLAYSTISQLGFMVAAVGVGAYVAAIFHLATHAVFKALLFMGSGSVIHGVEHGHHHAHAHGHGHDDHGHDDHHDEAFDPQDMRNMGGLRKQMPVTYWTYIVGTLALAGIFPFAGFWSKDEILADAWHVGFVENHLEGFLVLALLLIAAGFTAFYMWRQIEMVFHGKPRTEAAQQAPESSTWMTLPLVVLSLLTLGVGFINVPKGTPLFSSFFKDYEFKHFLESAIPSVTLGESLYFNVPLALAALGLGIGAILLARSIYGGDKAVVADEHSLGRDPLQRRPELGAIWSLANSRLYWDEIYFRILENPFNKIGAFLADVIDWNFWHDFFHDKIIGGTFNRLAAFLSKPIDVGIIDGAVNGVGWVTSRFSSRLRLSQTGYVRTYALAFLIGVVAVVIIMLLPLFQNGS